MEGIKVEVCRCDGSILHHFELVNSSVSTTAVVCYSACFERLGDAFVV